MRLLFINIIVSINKNQQRKMLLKKTVSIVGTSATKIPVDRCKNITVRGYYRKTSLLTQEYPSHNKLIVFKDVPEEYKKQLDVDLSRLLLEQLGIHKTDFLIIDLLDERFNICRINYSYGKEIVATKSNIFLDYLNNIIIDNNQTKNDMIRNIRFESTEYDKKISAFCKKLRGMYKQKEIIINECYLTTDYRDFDGNVRQFDAKTLNRVLENNDKLEKLYSSLKTNLPGANIISPLKSVHADINHKQGLNPMQYEDSYYEYISNQIKIITG